MKTSDSEASPGHAMSTRVQVHVGWMTEGRTMQDGGDRRRDLDLDLLKMVTHD